jgi:hypothetical protein
MAIRILNNNYGGRVSISSRGLGGRFQYIADPPTVPILLDTYTNAAAAYSLRKLRTAYTGSAIRVRRSSDNTETDIGFVNNALDTTALTTFCSAGNGFVTKWYNQAVNTLDQDVVQNTASNQPIIVSSGSVNLQNGKPAIKFNGTSTILSSLVAFNLTFSRSIFSVTKSDKITGNQTIFRSGSPSAPFIHRFITTNFSTQGCNDTFLINTPTTPTDYLLLTSIFGDTLANQFLNGVAGNTDTGTFSSAGTGPIEIGSFSPFNEYFSNNIQEVVMYQTLQLSNRIGIESNINSYYSIY